MRVVFDIEANGLENPDKIWLIVCKDIDTGEYHIFRRPSDDLEVGRAASEFLEGCQTLIGHNIIGYDIPVIRRLLGCLRSTSIDMVFIDTLVVSKLVNYSQKAHSIEYYGHLFGMPKGDFEDFSRYSQEMEDYCVRDTDISEAVYRHYLDVISDPEWACSLCCEQEFQHVVNDLHDNGFAFDVSRANRLLDKVNKELSKLDEAIHVAFPPRLKLVREVTPTYTKFGSLNRKDFRWVKDGDLSEFNGGPFCKCVWTNFNPASHKQVIDVLHSAGWKPVDRTATGIKNARDRGKLLDNQENDRYSWRINETNLSTLPPSAPASARSLARRILIESRRRTLTEWLSLCQSDQRIHGKFYSIGAWTHRMAHQAPNTANIPNGTDTQGKERPYGAEMRSLWCAPPGRLLIGVDAEGIQLRIFAHLINDPVFTKALVEGRKDDKSDPHSLNQKIMGRICRSRAAAKRFIYALLLGAGLGKLAEVLECSKDEANIALNRLLERYKGWQLLKEQTIPIDAERGYFIGLDGRKTPIYGQSSSERRHLAMSGYLQNGEAVVMKHATLRWHKVLRERGIEFKLVNFVHDEWQTECEEDLNTAIIIAQEQCNSLRWVGEQFKLNCPLAGSYWNDDLKNYTIGKNWKETH